MNILFLLGLFPHEYEKEIIKNSRSGIQNAANKFQWGLVNGFDRIDGVEVEILNSLYIGSYPKRFKKCFIPSFSFQHNGKKKGNLNVGFVNLSLYKNYSRFSSLKKAIKKRFDEKKPQVVIAYAMTTPFVELLSFIKKNYPDTICCLVVPDLPEYMNARLRSNNFYKIAKKLQNRHFKKNLRMVDGYVLLTDYMKKWFEGNINYVVVEGISLNTQKDLEQEKFTRKEKVIMYAGMIEEKYGVLDLVKAFMMIENQDWQLELYGVGSSLEQIIELAKKDRRIQVKGSVPNAQVLKRQKEVSFLINPRNDTDVFTKYSFPSKVIEYMGSGTPMLGYKLSGIPEEYTNYFYQLETGVQGMANSIMRALSCSDCEREEMGKRALRFIVSEKNAERQCRKIMCMLEQLVKNE